MKNGKYQNELSERNTFVTRRETVYGEVTIDVSIVVIAPSANKLILRTKHKFINN